MSIGKSGKEFHLESQSTKILDQCKIRYYQVLSMAQKAAGTVSKETLIAATTPIVEGRIPSEEES